MKREAPAGMRSGTFALAPVCVTGVGETRASSRLESFLEGHPHIDGVLVVGFAASLRDGLDTGDLVVARRLLTAGGGGAIECDRGLLRRAEAALERSRARYRTGDALTVGAALRTGEEKRSLGERTGALVATMEDYGLARACARRGVPFLSVRSVLDLATQELPAFVTGLGDRSLPVQAARVALNLAARPRHVSAVAKLCKQVRRAQSSLAPFVISFLDTVDSRSEADAVGAGSGP